MIRRFSAVSAVLLLTLAAGCSTNSELKGVHIPNNRPDTRITGQPPTLLEAGFAVKLNWTGSDADGRVVGYEWKISNNGVDGISPRDTLTVDPLTGAQLHPWRFTTANDSTFLVLADQAGFPNDDHDEPRSYRTHSLFIRAVDDQGAVDPVPAYISFTSTTIVPTCRVFYRNLGNTTAQTVPPTVNIGWEGVDEDFDRKVPTQVRFLWKTAQYGVSSTGLPRYIRTEYEYNEQGGQDFLDFEDPDWSSWRGYVPLQEDRIVKFPDQPDGEYFLFAVQVRDTAGAVSVGLKYGVEVANVRIKKGNFSPDVRIGEPFLGQATSSEENDDIAGGQPLNFIWSANADSYMGTIESYRHGWDLVDPDDPNDPGWAVPPGLSKQNLFAAQRSYQDGLHTFYLRVVDDSGQVKLVKWRLQVIPFISRPNQLELLLIDQVVDPDNATNNWLDQSNRPRNAEFYRNDYWQFLAAGSGGVSGMNWDRDRIDHRDMVEYSDLVKYKAVLCYARSQTQGQLMFNQFRPRRGVEQFVWLAPYQDRGGNFFLVGDSSMESFLEPLSNYMVPMIFDSRQPVFVVNGNTYITGFGEVELPDGEIVERGPRMYPYATAGITAISWTSPATKTLYGRNNVLRFDRESNCVGLKGLVLNPDFKAFHGIGPGVLADTLYTDPVIDWRDVANAQADTLALFNANYTFRSDEFYNGNAGSSRSEPIIVQECDVIESPDGMCIESMYQGISRMDWLRNIKNSQGDGDWPNSIYTKIELEDGCGPFALTSYNGVKYSSSVANGMDYGFMSYKTIKNKPVQKADVYWGFDPYRFNQSETRKAIRWVLEYFGLSINP